MPKIRKLSEVLPKEMTESESRPLDDYMDKTLIFYGCREVTGTNGPYMRIVCSLPESEEQFFLATGASQVVETMAYLKEQRLFPVTGRFVRAGRAILVKSD